MTDSLQDFNKLIRKFYRFYVNDFQKNQMMNK